MFYPRRSTKVYNCKSIVLPICVCIIRVREGEYTPAREEEEDICYIAGTHKLLRQVDICARARVLCKSENSAFSALFP